MQSGIAQLYNQNHLCNFSRHMPWSQKFYYYVKYYNHIVNEAVFETVELQRLQYKDCLPHNDIYSLKSNQNTNYENCRKWCSENSNCGGFTVWQNTCYFKNKNCKDGIRDHRETNLFLLLGNVNKLNSWSRKIYFTFIY